MQVVLDNPPALSSDAEGAKTDAQAYSLTAPELATDSITVTAPDGSTFSWKPTELVYRDESGQLDFIVGSTPSSLTTRGREARYVRTYPAADEVFCAEADRVKHFTVLHEPPREPAEYLGENVEFGISGIITGTVLPAGSHQTINAGVFRFPEPIVKDMFGNEIVGRYEVVDTTDGQQLFIWFAASFLETATYPVMIDPTVVVAANYDIRGTGRKLVRLSNNWLVAAVYTNVGPYCYFYKSSDDGTTWTQLCYITGSIAQGNTIASTGTTIYVLTSFPDHNITIFKFDAATISNTDLGSNVSYQTVIDVHTDLSYYSRSLAIDGAGGIHAVWSLKNSTYPNSYNLRYSKSADGGASWASVTQLTSDNSTNTDSEYPQLVVRSNNLPIIIYSYSSPTEDSIKCKRFNGSSWIDSTIYVGGFLPSVAVDGNDIVHVVWQGADTAYPANRVRYSKSADGGATWSAMEIVRNSAIDTYNASLTIANNNKLYVLAVGSRLSTIQVLLYSNDNDGTGWSSETQLTHFTTDGFIYPSVLWSKFNMNSPNFIRFLYLNPDTPSIMYESILINSGPNAPTGLTRANYDATSSAVFTWTFNDSDAGNTQSAYQLLIKRVSDGVTVLDTGKVASTVSSYTLAAGTLSNNVQYQWQVKTWDNSDTEGAYSSLTVFYTSAKPSVSVTTPATDGTTVATSNLTAEWSFSDPESEGQSAYQVKLTNNADAVLWNTGKVSDVSARSRTISYALTNSTSYKVKVMVWDAKDVGSAETVRTFTVSFTAPATPTINATAQNGYINVAVTNPTPTGSQPTVSSNDLYRRALGESTWERIATGIAANGFYNDYAIASGTTYEYKFTAIGDNGTTADSVAASSSITLTGVWLHDVSDPYGTVHNFKWDGRGRGADWKPEVEFMAYAGRSKPVAEFGGLEEGKVTVQLDMHNDDLDFQKLDALVHRKSSVCYRDGRGRKLFGVIGALPIADEQWGYTTTIEVTETAYSEVV
jgi:hypothetical protein